MSDEFFWDGYLHWARVLEKVRRETGLFAPGTEQKNLPPLYEPLFIRLTTFPSLQRSRELLDTIYAGEGDATVHEKIVTVDEFRFLDNYVFSLEDFLIGLEHFVTGETKSPLEFFIYRKLVHKTALQRADEAKFEIIDIGAPAFVEQQKSLLVVENPKIIGPKVIGAVIDNDIGFLNRRFRRNAGDKTRFNAIWLQARERLVETPQAWPNHMVIGRFLTGDDIDRMLADPHLDERATYLEINRDLHLFEPFRRFPPIDAHGSAVADLAFGSEPGGMDDVPLLAVQLPPEAAVDTSGTYSESYIVQGFRWLCWMARQIELNAALIVNISYGAMAGQKDGGKFIEAQIRREIELAARYGQEVHVVYAFGNSRNSRQIARVTLLPDAAPVRLTWCIAPDNPVPAFAEIRMVHRNSDGQDRLDAPPPDLVVGLERPGGGTRLTSSTLAGEANPPVSSEFDPAEARIYRVAERRISGRERQPEYLMAAIGPTRHLATDLPVAPAGDWTLTLRNETDAALDIVIQIQRGDTAPGFGPGGRQSYFEGAYVSTVEDGLVRRDVVTPLTNAGTQSAYTTASSAAQIHTAGAQLAVYGTRVDTDYSARGADWTAVKAPTDREVVDHLITRGISTTGAYSGSRTRLSGTSAAAALVSRRLLQDKRGQILI